MRLPRVHASPPDDPIEYDAVRDGSAMMWYQSTGDMRRTAASHTKVIRTRRPLSYFAELLAEPTMHLSFRYNEGDVTPDDIGAHVNWQLVSAIDLDYVGSIMQAITLWRPCDFADETETSIGVVSTPAAAVAQLQEFLLRQTDECFVGRLTWPYMDLNLLEQLLGPVLFTGTDGHLHSDPPRACLGDGCSMGAGRLRALWRSGSAATFITTRRQYALLDRDRRRRLTEHFDEVAFDDLVPMPILFTSKPRWGNFEWCHPYPRIAWRTQHAHVLTYALCLPDLPVYVLLWILQKMPAIGCQREYRVVRLIEGVLASVRRIKARG